jgi:hypothetical protein
MSVEIWPVIHLSNQPAITIENARIAQRCGCPGVFLISMMGKDSEIDPAAAIIRNAVPDLKIGINMLTQTPLEAVSHSIAKGYDATWSDYAWQEDAQDIWGMTFGIKHKFFAAVAMKGETHDEPNPEGSARRAAKYNFVTMTSGSSTGVTAPIEKIKRLRNALGRDYPLAMSGVHPPTADKLVPLTNYWLVATAISDDFYRFNETKLQYLKLQSEVAA